MGESDETPAWTARKLLRAARQASLATQASGRPFAGLVTPATMPDAGLLLLLSDLSEHTRHLRQDPRCALLIVGDAPEPNPQTAPRVTILGEAKIDTAPGLRERFLAVHPYAALYAGFGDFNIWRIETGSAAFVGGFARAFRLSAQDLAPDAVALSDVAPAAADIMGHCNADHAETMALLGGRAGATMVGVDVDGCDVAIDTHTVRVPWSRPVANPNDIRRELIQLARAARTAGPTPGAVPGR